MTKLALTTPGGFRLQGTDDMPYLGRTTLENVASWGTTVLMMIAVLLAILFLIWGGIQWITSGGNKEQVQAAQKKIMYAVIGLVVTLSAFFIINFIGDFFGADFSQIF